MKNKDKAKEPMLVKNPADGCWINMTALFALQEQVGTFAQVGDLVQEDVIRFINEECVITAEDGVEARNMFAILYQITDAFKSMEVVRC